MKGGTIDVLVIDDDAMVAAAVATYLDGDGQVVVIGHVEDPLQGVQRACAGDVDLVLVDIRLRSGDGFEVVEAIARLAPQVRCLLISSMPPVDALERAVAVGAYGVLAKGCGSLLLTAACRAAMSGCFTVDPHVFAGSWGRTVRPVTQARGPSHEIPLSPREVEVLGHLRAARSNRMMARAMGVSENTAKTHVANLLRKTGVASRGEAALLVVVDGVVQPVAPRAEGAR